MNYPSPRVPDQDAAALERPDRPNQWILDLGLGVHSGRRPWLRPLVAAAMTLVLPVLLRTIGDLDRGETPPDPDVVAITDRLTGLATVLAFILAGVLVVASVAYWVLCRYAHGVWKSLPEDERETRSRSASRSGRAFMKEAQASASAPVGWGTAGEFDPHPASPRTMPSAATERARRGARAKARCGRPGRSGSG